MSYVFLLEKRCFTPEEREKWRKGKSEARRDRETEREGGERERKRENCLEIFRGIRSEREKAGQRESRSERGTDRQTETQIYIER